MAMSRMRQRNVLDGSRTCSAVPLFQNGFNLIQLRTMQNPAVRRKPEPWLMPAKRLDWIAFTIQLHWCTDDANENLDVRILDRCCSIHCMICRPILKSPKPRPSPRRNTPRQPTCPWAMRSRSRNVDQVPHECQRQFQASAWTSDGSERTLCIYVKRCVFIKNFVYLMLLL